MLYMVEVHYLHDRRDAALRYFWDHGATHYRGIVSVRGSWVATHERVAYVLVDAADDNELAKANEPLLEFGRVIFRQVTSFDQI